MGLGINPQATPSAHKEGIMANPRGNKPPEDERPANPAHADPMIAAAGSAGSEHGGDMGDAAAAMVERQVRAESGLPPPPTVVDADEDAKRAAEREDALNDREIHLHVDHLAASGLTLGDYEKVEPMVAPGETERGWSPEVTARHPALLAETMEELAGGSHKRTPKIQGIDPHDPAALTAALRENGFAEVRETMLINDAIRLNSDRLAAAQGEADRASPHHAEVASVAIEKMRDLAEGRGVLRQRSSGD